MGLIGTKSDFFIFITPLRVSQTSGCIMYNTDTDTIKDIAYSPSNVKLFDELFTPPTMDDSDTISLAFLISLSVTFAVLMVVLIVVAIYVTFCGADESEYDEEAGLGRNTGGGIHGFFQKKKGGILLDSSFASPGQFDDDAIFQEQEAAQVSKMSAFELDLYYRAKEFQRINPPNVKEFGTFLNESDIQFIKDRGIQSYFLLPSINDNTDQDRNFLPSFLIQDKLDISFTKYNKSSSTIMNYPLPFNKKDAVYFEVKVFKHSGSSNAVFSIGLMTFPYPYFRIPGMSLYSIAYESTGKLRINNPFMASTLLPKLQEGDVVGFGYRFRTGTVFITHNGKKLMDVTQNVGIDLFIGIGSLNAAYTRTYTKDGLLEDPDNVELRELLSEGRDIDLPGDLQTVHDPTSSYEIESDEVELHVNLGQVGFVFIEANVKKYAFGSLYGEIGIPPSYNGTEITKDTILQKGEDIPPKYHDEAQSDTFFGNITINNGSNLSAVASGSRLSSATKNQGLPSISEETEEDNERYERFSSAYDREHNFSNDDLPNNSSTANDENGQDMQENQLNADTGSKRSKKKKKRKKRSKK